jgi:hypothetical protein
MKPLILAALPLLAPLLSFLPAAALDIQPPTGWQRQFSLPPGISAQYISPERKDGFAPNLTVAEEDAGAEADRLRTTTDLLGRLEKNQVRLFPLFKVLRKEERKAGGVPGGLLVVSYAYGPLDIAAYQFVFRRGSKITTLVYSCLARDLGDRESEFVKSLGTLALTAGP